MSLQANVVVLLKQATSSVEQFNSYPKINLEKQHLSLSLPTFLL